MIERAMARPKNFDRNLNLPITSTTLDRIDAVLNRQLGEFRLLFVRRAIEETLEKRERAVARKRRVAKKSKA